MNNSKDYTVNGKCPEHCGKCCSSILPISKAEAREIKKYIKENDIKPVVRNSVLDSNYKDICPFLNEEMKCNIYSVRPEICRSFMCNGQSKSFNYGNKEIVNFLMEFFPGAYKGKIPNVEQINKLYQRRVSSFQK